MTLEEFVNNYNGRKVDYDGVYGAQCVDLFRQYAVDVLLIAEHTGVCATSGGAKDLFLDYDKMPVEKKYFSKSYGRRFVAGDVLIWGETEKNKYGHVAIFLADLVEGKKQNSVIVFEQDGIKKDGAKIAIRSRNNLLGFLRKK